MKPLSARTSRFTDSVIRRMTRVSLRYGAVNLSQGFPDFDPPRELTDRLAAVAHEGPHQYSVTWGAANFRQALAEKQARFMGMPIDPESGIVVTCGSTEAMMAAVMTVADPGDKIAIFSPFYENYDADAILCGAEPIYVPLIPPLFSLDAERLEDAFRQGAKALVLCNPSNPSGKVFSRSELEEIAFLAGKYDAWVITDEVYEHIVYEPLRHTYMASLPGMAGRTLSCSSLSKTYSITGWRLGYVIAAAPVVERVRKVHDFLTVGAAAPLQEAAVAGLRMDDSYYAGLLALYARKRKIMLDGLRSLGIPHTEPQGAYYVLLDISGFGWDDDVLFCEKLAERVGVGAVPGSSFFHEPEHRFIRLHFAKKDETLHEALDRLSSMRTRMSRP
ncbi:MAG: pyridoxal phosphate-dependent aminotransferase [Mailhella sp.]|nr:pyridoxal phosphate-dependent aminotransferase [Mailhella sp.]